MSIREWFKNKAAERAEEEKEQIMKIERDIIMALRQVYDPEIPVNVYDLGLIYEIKVNDDHEVYIQMTLTAPNCPMADYVMEQVKTAVEDVPGVVSVKIDLVFEPVWDKSRMSEEALIPYRLKHKVNLDTYNSRNILHSCLYLLHDIICHRTVRCCKSHLDIYLMVLIDLDLINKSKIIYIHRYLRIIYVPESYDYISFKLHLSFLIFLCNLSRLSV